jgi:hypothetical protein
MSLPLAGKLPAKSKVMDPSSTAWPMTTARGEIFLPASEPIEAGDVRHAFLAGIKADATILWLRHECRLCADTANADRQTSLAPTRTPSRPLGAISCRPRLVLLCKAEWATVHPLWTSTALPAPRQSMSRHRNWSPLFHPARPSPLQSQPHG